MPNSTRATTDGLLFRQPSILLVYVMVASQPASAKRLWPFTPEELRPIYTDLGKPSIVTKT